MYLTASQTRLLAKLADEMPGMYVEPYPEDRWDGEINAGPIRVAQRESDLFPLYIRPDGTVETPAGRVLEV